MNTTESQWKRARNYMLTGRSLTMYDMLIKFGIGNHTGRIADIRKHYGYDYINTEMKEMSNGKVIGVYTINPDYLELD